MSNLDRTLDDLIKTNKTPRAGARPSRPGPSRRFPDRAASRAAPYAFTAGRAPPRDHDGMFAQQEAYAPPVYSLRGAAGVSDLETGTKLLVSNLHYGVSDDDIKELFSGVGYLKKCSVNYDRSGRSEGTAEVVYHRRQDAESAIKRYNNVQLDGKPMKIEIVGVNMTPPAILPQIPYGGYRNNIAPIRNARFQGRGGGVRRSEGGGRGGMRRDRGGGGGRGRGEKISAEDLDADLEKYLSKAKETTD